MPERNIALSEHSCWWPDTPDNDKRLPDTLYKWLLDKGSLTAALTTLSEDNFRVEIKSQSIKTAYPHEQQKLNLAADQQSLVREVELHIYDQAVVFARSIIPLDLAGSNNGGLENLGTKPLGHLLFKDGNIRVSKREFAQIKKKEMDIFARRTPYDYEGQQILVSEFFLPEFLQFIN